MPSRPGFWMVVVVLAITCLIARQAALGQDAAQPAPSPSAAQPAPAPSAAQPAPDAAQPSQGAAPPSQGAAQPAQTSGAAQPAQSQGAAQAAPTPPVPPPPPPPPPPPGHTVPAPSSPDASAAVSTDPGELVRQMGEQVRRLGQDVSSSQSASQGKGDLTSDLERLARSLAEFHSGLGPHPDLKQLGQDYFGIDASWHQIKARLDQSGVANDATQHAEKRVGELDARIHETLRLAQPPQSSVTAPPQASATAPQASATVPPQASATAPPQASATAAGASASAPTPDPLTESRRLSRALAERAQYLAAVVQADSASVPNRARLVQEVVDLSKQSDQYVESLARTDRPDLARDGFARIAAIAESLSRDLSVTPLPQRVHVAWDAFVSADESLGQHLSMPGSALNPAATAPATASAAAPAASQSTRLSDLADLLLNQAQTLLVNFTPNMPYVREGAYFLADIQALRDSATRFRQDVASGSAKSQLLTGFRNAEAAWSRLAWRVYRITPYNPTPNGRLALSIGNTCALIRQELGTPGSQPAASSALTPAVAAVPAVPSTPEVLTPIDTTPVLAPAPAAAGGAAPAPAPPGTSAEPVRVPVPAGGAAPAPAPPGTSAQPVPVPAPPSAAHESAAAPA